MQLRLGARSRTTKDIDLLIIGEVQEVYPQLREAGAIDLGDWFTFEVSDTIQSDIDDVGGLRYHLHSFLDGRTFEMFHIDIGIGDPLLAPVDYLETPTLLAFAGIEPTVVPCYPLTQQIAEKYHAFTRPHVSGISSRVKDFVDMLLLARMGELDSESLRQAIRATFGDRKTHELPVRVPLPSKGWTRPFQKMAVEVGLESGSLPGAGEALRQFLEPALADDSQLRWNPTSWRWE